MSVHFDMARFRSLSLAALSLAILTCLATPAVAQGGGGIVKEPREPSYTGGFGQVFVGAGARLKWRIVLPPALPGLVNFIDEPQHPECEPGGLSRYDTPGGSTEDPAAQPWETFPDTNGDGNCIEAVVTLPAGAVATCNKALEQLIITNINTAVGGTIEFVTDIDPLATPNAVTCNWGHFTNPALPPTDPGALVRSTKEAGRIGDTCTCLNIAPPSGFAAEATKVAAPEVLPLIPDDPASTIVYTITATNTGSEDIAGMTYTDNLTPANGLEWVDIVDCPAPLNCTMVPPNDLSVTGWDLPSTDPDTTQQIRVRARVTCGAATVDDTGQACNQGTFDAPQGSIPTDDPSTVSAGDPTCTPVIFSNLGDSTKVFDSYDDSNGNGQLDAGERVRFAITARNTGRMTATGVTITDTLLLPCFDPSTIVAEDGGTAGGGVVSWSVGDLVGNFGEATVHFTVVLRADALCCNQASIQSSERLNCSLAAVRTDDPITPATDDATCILPGPQPDLVITKDFSGTPTAGGPLTWTVTITNNGAGPATSAQFLDDFAASPCNTNFDRASVTFSSSAGGNAGTDNSVSFSTFPPPPTLGRVQIDDLGGPDGIQPGETITITFVTDIFDLTCCNQGQVRYAERAGSAPTDDPQTPGFANDPTCINRPVPGPAGQLVKTKREIDVNGDGFLAQGDQIEYTIVFTNTGDVDLTNVILGDLSSPCITFDISTLSITPPANGTDGSSGNSVRVNVVSPFAPANSVTVVVRATINIAGDCCNSATWASTELPGPTNSDRDPADIIDEEPTCHTAVDIPAPDVSMGIVKSSDALGVCVDPGATVNFSLRVANTGRDPVSGWSISDPLPAGFTNVAVDAPLTLAGNTVSLTGGPNLAAGETRTYTYRADVPCDRGGSLDNTATLTYTAPAGTVTKDSATQVNWSMPDFTSSTKTLDSFDPNSNGYNEAGEPVVYTITVTNLAACDARNVVVTDTLDARFDPASVTFAAGDTGNVVGNVITWRAATVPELANVVMGVPVTLTFNVNVLAATPQDQQLSNTFVVDAPDNVALCPGLSAQFAPPAAATGGANGGVVQWGQVVVGGADLLRNAMVSCLSSAFATMNSTIMPLRAPRDLNATAPAPPVTLAGDASTARPPVNSICPQADPVAFPDNRILIFYELTDATVNDLRVSKSGANIRLNWTP